MDAVISIAVIWIAVATFEGRLRYCLAGFDDTGGEDVRRTTLAMPMFSKEQIKHPWRMRRSRRRRRRSAKKEEEEG